MQRDNWAPYLIDRGAFLNAVMVDQSRKQPQMLGRFLNRKSSNRVAEDFRTVSGLGLMDQITAEIPDQWPYEDFTDRQFKRFTHSWFGLGMQFSKRFMMDEMDRFGAARGRELMRAARNTQEFYAAAIFNNMTSIGTAYVLPDGKALAAASGDPHPLMDNVLGGTASYSNHVGATLAHDSLIDAMIIADKTPNDRGLPEVRIPKIVGMNPSLGPRAAEIMESMLRSDTAENAKNVVRSYRLTPIPWHFVASASAWWVQCDQHEIDWFDRQGIQQEVTRDFDNKSLKATVDAMWSVGSRDWRGFVGGTT